MCKVHPLFEMMGDGDDNYNKMLNFSQVSYLSREIA